MRVIVAGSKSIQHPSIIAAAIEASGLTVTELVSGTARGADRLGEAWAEARGIPVARFPADWQRLGKRAGYVRNQAMVQYAAAAQGGLVAVWDGVSPGTRHTVQLARAYGIAVYLHLTAGGVAVSTKAAV